MSIRYTGPSILIALALVRSAAAGSSQGALVKQEAPLVSFELNLEEGQKPAPWLPTLVHDREHADWKRMRAVMDQLLASLVPAAEGSWPGIDLPTAEDGQAHDCLTTGGKLDPAHHLRVVLIDRKGETVTSCTGFTPQFTASSETNPPDGPSSSKTQVVSRAKKPLPSTLFHSATSLPSA